MALKLKATIVYSNDREKGTLTIFKVLKFDNPGLASDCKIMTYLTDMQMPLEKGEKEHKYEEMHEEELVVLKKWNLEIELPLGCRRMPDRQAQVPADGPTFWSSQVTITKVDQFIQHLTDGFFDTLKKN